MGVLFVYGNVSRNRAQQLTKHEQMLTVQPCAHPHSGKDVMQMDVSEELAASTVRVVQNWTYFSVNFEDGKFLRIVGMKL